MSRFALKKEDLLERAELMLEQAEKINCRQFVTPKVYPWRKNILSHQRYNFCKNLVNPKVHFCKHSVMPKVYFWKTNCIHNYPKLSRSTQKCHRTDIFALYSGYVFNTYFNTSLISYVAMHKWPCEQTTLYIEALHCTQSGASLQWIQAHPWLLAQGKW